MPLGRSAKHNGKRRTTKLRFESLETRQLMAVTPLALPQIQEAEVELLLQRAAAASASEDAIIAIVDRGGHILGVRAEQDVLDTITDTDTLVFAIDGAVAKARTAAFFANDAGPLTSRTIRALSQSTVTEREVESNPNDPDPASTTRGPGFVAPIGIGGHFPFAVAHTPPVDLFAIEHTNRDSIIHPGLDSIKGTADDIPLENRFNVDDDFIPPGLTGIDPPESYGFTSGLMVNAQSRGIATLPGGIPIYRNGVLVGGIGVFFPGEDGYATHEQNFIPGIRQTEAQRTNAAKVLESEWIAFAAIGGSSMANARVGIINGVPAVPFNLPFGRIDLVGLTLPIVGPEPGPTGVKTILKVGKKVGVGDPNSGADQQIDISGDLYAEGQAVPEGWLVTPHDSPTGSITAADVVRIIEQGVDEAEDVRAAIRLQQKGGKFIPGARTSMVLAVADLDGNVLGLFRMPDATVFSIDVAVAKARNTGYYADPTQLLDIDRVDDNHNGIPDPNVPAGAAFSNRTFRFLAEPRYPAGVDGSRPGAFSILNDPGFKTNLLSSHKVAINTGAVENAEAPVPASAFLSVLGFDAFNPGRNFRNPNNIANQNGIVFFPGSSPLYSGSVLIGGFGVSGDGVDQDDVVTFFGQKGYEAPKALRADQFFVRGTRLPYQKFLRNPRA